ncbi:hypothetical protein C0991_001289 [Blastosporella zonata]|nr:hypothetical protein C0991_001289 [Blastosporella zonata]
MKAPLIFLALLTSLVSDSNAASNLTSLVNLFIGTASGAGGASGGNAFPDNYTVFACYDFTAPDHDSELIAFGTYQSVSTSSPSNILVSTNITSLTFPFQPSVSAIQAGALFSFNSSTVLARFGVSFKSTQQACMNAEEEIPDWDWDKVEGASRDAWEDVLSRVVADPSKEDATVLELFYSSFLGYLSNGASSAFNHLTKGVV